MGFGCNEGGVFGGGGQNGSLENVGKFFDMSLVFG